jgi:hypothetical protein
LFPYVKFYNFRVIALGFLKKSCSSFSVVGFALLLSGVGFQLSAQVVENRRLDRKLDSRTVVGAGERGPSSSDGLDLSFTATIAYDDNIFQSSGNEQSSLVVEVEPTVGWAAGSREGTWVRLAYSPTGVIYLSESDESRVDHRVEVEGAIELRAVTLAYSAQWARLGSPSADVGGQSDRNDYGGRVAAIYEPKGKLSYVVSAERSAIDFVESGFFDFFESSAGVSTRYRYSSKTEVGLAYRYGRVEIDEAGEQTFHQIGAQAEWRPRQKFALSLEGGLEYRNYESGSGTEPYLAARVDWTPRTKTAFFGEIYRRQEASGAVEGENFNLTGFRVGVNQVLRDGWSARLEMGRETSDYFATTGAVASGRDDAILFVRPSISYAFGDHSVLAFLYQYSENDSTDPDFGYENHQFGVSLTHQF